MMHPLRMLQITKVLNEIFLCNYDMTKCNRLLNYTIGKIGSNDPKYSLNIVWKWTTTVDNRQINCANGLFHASCK